MTRMTKTEGENGRNRNKMEKGGKRLDGSLDGLWILASLHLVFAALLMEGMLPQSPGMSIGSSGHP